ncbi:MULTISPECIES: flagellar basal body-associated FliL family protein [unclassified Paenibacillus]|uniref:flagellar basal body-associated FliL family protein n=1 Tax=unclassified Paenibacillus TaxID=185978 RepID=UPI000838F5B4|nr:MULTISPECIES: flagellar basal body-associated FliL family protein [unclassified Paenibacillus]NWL86395.1 flagellar basal body protein FliL [Paenibacillus sp. 79R4]
MKKMAPWLITILLAITLIVLAAFLLMNQITSPDRSSEVKNAVGNVAVPKSLSADEIVQVTSTIEGIKTNLSDAGYVVGMDFAFQMDSATTKEAFDKIKDYKIKPIIIKTLADTKPDELTGAKGKDNLSSKLLNLINKSLPEGKLIQIDITNFIMQPIF